MLKRRSLGVNWTHTGSDGHIHSVLRRVTENLAACTLPFQAGTCVVGPLKSSCSGGRVSCIQAYLCPCTLSPPAPRSSVTMGPPGWQTQRLWADFAEEVTPMGEG